MSEFDGTGGGRYGPNTEALERLLSDARVLGPSGIERIAWGWSRYAAGGLEACTSAEKTARRLIDETGRQEAWRAAEGDLKELVEGHYAQSAWRSEPASIVGRPSMPRSTRRWRWWFAASSTSTTTTRWPR